MKTRLVRRSWNAGNVGVARICFQPYRRKLESLVCECCSGRPGWVGFVETRRKVQVYKLLVSSVATEFDRCIAEDPFCVVEGTFDTL